MRQWSAAAAAVLALTGVPLTITTISPSGEAEADVCGSVGRRVSVGGCVDVAGAVANYAPPPDYYAPLPEDLTPNASACVGYNGRWVSANGCTP
ncbi:hypothetical protein [Mycolicibacterium palauense]|uniref:hypothetical protein n=1 Tax=Mycolicibacterium palauense TaxID=2034511 RepID=UPI000BFEB536|nr:hypothetical protein [Mycolicibacterium palauense]